MHMESLKNNLRKLLFSKLGDKSIERFYRIYYRLRYPRQMSKKYSFGMQNQEIIFYVIRPREDCIEGLMSLFMNVAKNVYYAKEHGYVPIVDFQNYKTQYDDKSITCPNAWEYYFTQPSQYRLEEVYQSKNVILSGLEIQWYRPSLFERNFSNDELCELYKNIFSYIQLNENVHKAVASEISQLDIDCKKTLGLYLRGTDYIALKPAGHPVQPTVRQARKIVDEYLQMYEIEKIFLVTEDGNIYNEISEIYGNKCVIVSFDHFINNYNGKKFLSHNPSIEELSESPYIRGMNYLVKLIILSKCAYFIGGNTMGSWAANIFANNQFIAKHIFDLGIYGK